MCLLAVITRMHHINSNQVWKSTVEKSNRTKNWKKKRRRRPKTMFLDHVMTKNGKRRYGHLKEIAQYTEDLCGGNRGWLRPPERHRAIGRHCRNYSPARDVFPSPPNKQPIVFNGTEKQLAPGFRLGKVQSVGFVLSVANLQSGGKC